ncbi:MAG: hypothetical protein MUF54_07180 [Polyangiaceae bacterium]|nr:hypothetical protein [Polyangiaceae bacterium]
MSVMASGCLAPADGDFGQEALDEESIGSVQQTATLPAGATKNVTCGTRAFIKSQVDGDGSAASAIFDLCTVNRTDQVAVSISGKTHQFYDASSGDLAFEKGIWYAAAKAGPPANARWDSRLSCFAPYAHFVFRTTGFDTWTGCANGNHVLKYHEFDSTERINECNNTMNSPLRTMSESNGTSIEADCSNVVGFDPGSTLDSPCGVSGGWMC